VPDSRRAATDVGVSYGVVAIAGALTGEWPSELRPLWAFGWLAVLGTEPAVGRTFTQAGHLCALLLGFAAAGWLRRRGSGARRAPIGLLAIGSAALAVRVRVDCPNGGTAGGDTSCDPRGTRHGHR
jgi:hypothetical protein